MGKLYRPQGLPLCASVAAMCIASSAAAQGTYPDRPIRWILPIAASGGSDTLARTIQGGFTESIGQQIVIDNRPGGSSVIGTEIAAKRRLTVTRCCSSRRPTR